MEHSPLPPQIQTLPDEELKKVKEFQARKEVQEWIKPKHNDFYCSRYLRARKFNLDEAVIMFVNSMKWREKMNVDNIDEAFQKNKHKDLLLSYWPASAFWPDPPTTHDGSIIIMEALGRVDPSIIDAVGQENLMQYHIWSMEQLEAKWFKMVADKGYWPGFVMFEDLGGLGWHSLSSKVLGIVAINQNFYPDMLRKMWVINVPSIFYMSWKVIQLWLEPRTLVKITLCSGGIKEVEEDVYKVVDRDAMPVRLGGTGTKDIGEGGAVGHPSMKLLAKTEWLNVGRADKYEIQFNFAANDIVSYQFKTKYNDIGFHVGLKEKDDIIANARHDSDKRVIEGSFTVVHAGKYTFHFDNTYSWTKGKQVKFNVKKNAEILYPK